LLILAWLINDNDDPRIGINKLDESVIYSTKSEFKIIGSSESKSVRFRNDLILFRIYPAFVSIKLHLDETIVSIALKP
jgi:hypothetical protein